MIKLYNFYMIKNRLSIIMGEKRMRISEVAKLTGVAYSAIHSIYYDKTKGIEFQTLDKLCTALNCNTQELFRYIPDDLH